MYFFVVHLNWTIVNSVLKTENIEVQDSEITGLKPHSF